MFGVDKRTARQKWISRRLPLDLGPLLLVTFAMVTMMLVLASGCQHFRVQQQYVDADRATFNVVAPVVRALADEDPANDPDLSGVNGRAVLLMLDTWEIRLEAAEGGE